MFSDFAGYYGQTPFFMAGRWLPHVPRTVSAAARIFKVSVRIAKGELSAGNEWFRLKKRMDWNVPEEICLKNFPGRALVFCPNDAGEALTVPK